MPALLLACHPARQLLHLLFQLLHACLELALADFAGQGGFVSFLATEKGRRALGEGWRDAGLGQLPSGGEAEVATWTPHPITPVGLVPPAKGTQAGRQRDLARDPQRLCKPSLPLTGSATKHPRDKGHLSPCPGPPCVAPAPLHAVPHRFPAAAPPCPLSPSPASPPTATEPSSAESTRDATAGWQLPPRQPSTPRLPTFPQNLPERHLKPLQGCERLGRQTNPCWSPAWALPG